MKPSAEAAGHVLPAIRLGNGVLGVALALVFFWVPAVMILEGLGELRDPAGVPSWTYGLHRRLSDRYERWARQRLASGRAERVDVTDVADTEWPLFGSVFYLWATEGLQQRWGTEQGEGGAGTSPMEHAQGAVEAAADLLADPGHATWVRHHWGEEYLERDNLFYRMLLVAGLGSYQRLTGNERFEPLLRDQATSLARELDASPHGLLDDYPGQAFPVDVLPAYAAIAAADPVLDTDHLTVVARGMRAFVGDAVDPLTGLPAYRVDAGTGESLGPARGVGVAYMSIWALTLWPDSATAWYDRFHDQFWDDGTVLAGFRELSRSSGQAAWMVDVDAGPVIAGLGTAASGFGLGAARVHGRRREAYALGAEALAAAWPIPTGTLLGARLVSDASDAPYLAESALLFLLSRTARGEPTGEPGPTPLIVWLAVLGLVFAGSVYVAIAARGLLAVRDPTDAIARPGLQVPAWGMLVAAGTVALVTSTNPLIGLVLLSGALLLPRPPADVGGPEPFE